VGEAANALHDSRWIMAVDEIAQKKVAVWMLLGSIGENRIKGDTISMDVGYQRDTHAVSPVERSIRRRWG